MNNEDFIKQPKARFVHPRLGFKQAPKLLKKLEATRHAQQKFDCLIPS